MSHFHLLSAADRPIDEIPSHGQPGWHDGHPELGRALAEAHRSAPHLQALANHLLPCLPRKPRASQTIRAITIERRSDPCPLDQAVTLPWLALDSSSHRNAIVVDIDHADGPERAAQLASAYGLPRPSVVIDPWSARSHALFLLATPVGILPKARTGPRLLCDLAGRLLAAAMHGTLLPAGTLVKNPWGEIGNLIGQRLRRGPAPVAPLLWKSHQAAGNGLMWHTEPGDLRLIELREIVAALAEEYEEIVTSHATRAHFGKSRGEPDARGRNCALFDLVRWWAYDCHEKDGGRIQEEADRVNAGFPDPLPAAEVRATARSISRFMMNRYKPGAIKRHGRDHDGSNNLTPRARQAFAGRATAACRTAHTEVSLKAALGRLRAAGRSVTQTATAAESGISLSTVKRHWLSIIDGEECHTLSLSGSRAAK